MKYKLTKIGKMYIVSTYPSNEVKYVKTKPDLKEELEQAIIEGSQNWVNKKISI